MSLVRDRRPLPRTRLTRPHQTPKLMKKMMTMHAASPGRRKGRPNLQQVPIPDLVQVT